jgi:hypothetical protein
MIMDGREMINLKQMIEVINHADDPALPGIIEAIVRTYAPHRPDLVVEWGDKGLTVRRRPEQQQELPGVKE